MDACRCAATLPGTPLLVLFRYSPLGLTVPGENLRVVHGGRMAHETDPPVLLRPDGRPRPWTPHMWWTRFAVAARAATLGTRHEPLAEWSAVAAVVRVWLTQSTFTERARFFRCPDLRALWRRTLQRAPGHGDDDDDDHDREAHRRRLRGLLRVVPLLHPAVLQAIPGRRCEGTGGKGEDGDDDDDEFSSQRTLTLLHRLCRTHPALCPGTMAYGCTVADLDHLLMHRYGACLAEVGGTDAAAGHAASEPLLPAETRPPAHLALARVERHADLGCAVLRLGSGLVTSLDADALWRGGARALCRLLSAGTTIVLLDAPVGERRALYAPRYPDDGVHWLAPALPAALNWIEESDGAVRPDSVTYFVVHRAGAARGSRAAVLDGAEDLAPTQQLACLEALAAQPPAWLVIGGDTGGRLPGAAVDLFTGFVWSAAAVRDPSPARCWHADAHGGRRLRVLRAETARRTPPAPVVTVQPSPLRWLTEQVEAGRVDLADTAVVVCGHHEREAVLAATGAPPLAGPGPRLVDRTTPRIGSVLRCVRPADPVLVFGECYTVVSAAAGPLVRLRARSTGESLDVALDGVCRACVHARVGLLMDAATLHHAARRVLVCLTGTFAGRVHTAAHVVACVGAPSRLEVVTRANLAVRLSQRPAADPSTPALWRDVMRHLHHASAAVPRREERKGAVEG